MKTTRREAIRTLAVAGGALIVGCEGDLMGVDAGGRDASTSLDADARSDARVPAFDADAEDDGGAIGDGGGAPDDAGPSASDAATDAETPPGFVLGETKPTAANTGLNVEGISASSLTTVSGNVTHSMNDVVFERQRFTGRVSITGKRITYRNCWFNGPHTARQALAQCSNTNCEAIVFESCLFLPSSFGESAADALGNCVFGHDFRLSRCDVSGGIDLLGLYSGATTVPARNVEVLGSFLHDMTYFSPDAGHADNQTHNDAIQVHMGAQRMRVFGNTIIATVDPARGQASDPPVTGSGGEHLSGNKYYPGLPAMSGFMFSPVNETAGIDDIEIDRNWLAAGQVHVNWPRTDGVNVRITNNRWGAPTHIRTAAGDSFYVLMRTAQTATISGNVMEATGAPYDRRMNG